MEKIALIVGASGIVGSNLARELLAHNWTVYGLARRPPLELAGLQPLAADLLDPATLVTALANVAPTHVFLTSWMRQATEADNIRVNGAMVRNLLASLSPKRSVQHVALVTGLKHYLGPFDSYARAGVLPPTPVREEMPRLDVANFYYAQEDEVFAAAARDGFTWSVHRPHTIIGQAVGNLMNMGTTLAVYASLCKELGQPFRWPGSQAQWQGLSDVTDARVLAQQLAWAATTKAAANQAFNITNGDYFRWNWLWPRLAGWFGIEAVGYEGTVQPLDVQLAHAAEPWRQLAAKYQLAEPTLGQLASPWHTDLDLGRPIEVMTDMSKSRELDFHVYQRSDESFFDLFAQLRASRLIP